ncbi:hypothetical protein [Marinobacter sp. X15-166B]|uniref:hypothetical protein n=1 Tax=Marinobacter sp. X15-166B TaxID=1897620 RepID=UPI00085C2789|nr:hypothetical protein [Marinobacter sp. X15-166B]OEY66835.1 hypothetical protein BG841_10455 [Marinobacter sp. X15-166B]
MSVNRKAFEAWAASELQVNSFERYGSGQYMSDIAEYAWRGWQANHFAEVSNMVEPDGALTDEGTSAQGADPEGGAKTEALIFNKQAEIIELAASECLRLKKVFGASSFDVLREMACMLRERADKAGGERGE